MDQAIRQVSLGDMDWLETNRFRILSSNVFESASALAELRTYGALLEAGYDVRSIRTDNKKPTPDFMISDGPNTVLVEVHAKQYDGATEKALEQHREMIATRPARPGVTVYQHNVFPFGKPAAGKPGDSTTTNAISRICGIKPKEHQLSDDVPSILWLDFQDLYTGDMALTAEQFNPVISWNEHITSGALWYALYGWRGAPIFEQCHYSHLDMPSQIKHMAHNGRFFLPNKLSAVIVSLPNATILAESPHKKRQLPVEVRMRYMAIPWAGIQHSLAEWTNGLVLQTLKSHAALITGIVGDVFPIEYPDHLLK